MKINRFIIGLITIAIVIAITFFVLSDEDDHPEINLALGKNLWCSLPIIAAQKGIFVDNGVKVNLVFQDAGRYCMDALLAGSVEFAAVVEANVAYVGFTGNTKPVIFTEVVTSSCGLICRGDRGISTIDDLKDKIIAYTPATGAEPYLFRLLEKNNIPIGEVQLRKMHPKALQPAIISGEIDGAATWEPFMYNISNSLNGKVVEFRDPEAFTGYMFVATSKELLGSDPELVNAVYNSLKQAEEYISNNPTESQQFLADYLSMDLEAVKGIWRFFDMSTGLNEEAILNSIKYIAENARLTDENFKGKPVPDYSQYFNTSIVSQEN